MRGLRTTAVACGLAVAAGALVSASGVLADATPARPQAVRAHLAYNCRFPAGPQRVSATVAATFPTTAVAYRPIKVSGLRISVTFPPPVAAELRKLGAATVTGRDVLSVAEADNATVVTTLWPGQARKPVPVPGRGRLHLTFSGRVPPPAASTPGTVTFTAAQLNIALTPPAAGGLSSTPAAIPVNCTLTSPKHAELAAVQVTAAPAKLGNSGGTRHGKDAGAARGGGIPPGCGKQFIHGGVSSPVLGCAYLIGYADVKKLNGAALIGPAPSGDPAGALLNIDTYGGDFGCVPKAPSAAACAKKNGTIHAYNCTAGRLDYHKELSFPPAEATFLGFKFVPVTAVMQLSETTWPVPPKEDPRCYKGFNPQKPVKLKSPIISIFTDINTNVALGEPITNVGTTYLAIHVSQVAVNGVPLPVGPDCGTTQAVRAVLNGHGVNLPEPMGYTLAGGGPLTGTVTIPAFQHCGQGENLDPLFTASISGPANFQLITQGVLCTPHQGRNGCPPKVPKPLRHVKS